MRCRYYLRTQQDRAAATISAGPRCGYCLGRTALRLLSQQDRVAATISAGPRCAATVSARAALERCGYYLGAPTGQE